MEGWTCLVQEVGLHFGLHTGVESLQRRQDPDVHLVGGRGSSGWVGFEVQSLHHLQASLRLEEEVHRVAPVHPFIYLFVHSIVR